MKEVQHFWIKELDRTMREEPILVPWRLMEYATYNRAQVDIFLEMPKAISNKMKTSQYPSEKGAYLKLSFIFDPHEDQFKEDDFRFTFPPSLIHSDFVKGDLVLLVHLMKELILKAQFQLQELNKGSRDHLDLHLNRQSFEEKRRDALTNGLYQETELKEKEG